MLPLRTSRRKRQSASTIHARRALLELARIVVDRAVVLARFAVRAVPVQPALADIGAIFQGWFHGRIGALAAVLTRHRGAGRCTDRTDRRRRRATVATSTGLARVALLTLHVRRALTKTSRTRQVPSTVHARSALLELARIVVDRTVVLARLAVQAVPMEIAETRVRPIDQRWIGRAGGRVCALSLVLARHRRAGCRRCGWRRWRHASPANRRMARCGAQHVDCCP